VSRIALLLVTFGVALAACSGGTDVDVSEIPELPTATTEDVEALLTSSELPVVLNVWASWCIPCRSEAPLLDRAADEFSDRVQFIGLNVRDSQLGAREFIAEFLAEADIDHLFDQPGDVPSALGGTRGVPLTFFYAPGGELVELHFGVIDERTLALQIDEITRR
jgi:thiol-disulfide isomerase/thioredoxin